MRIFQYNLALYIAWLFIVWFLYAAFVYEKLVLNNGLIGHYAGEIFRVFIFLAPLAYLLKSFTDKEEFKTLTNCNTAKKFALGLALSLGFALIFLPLTLLANGKSISIDAVNWLPLWAGISIAVIVEELVFRGYILSKLLRYGRLAAVSTSSVLFVLIHYPGWWFHGAEYSFATWLQQSGSILILGVILALAFIKYRSLVICILLHSTNNLIAKMAL